MYDRDKQIFHLHWNGIDIEIGYDPSLSPSHLKYYGEHMAHTDYLLFQPLRHRSSR